MLFRFMLSSRLVRFKERIVKPKIQEHSSLYLFKYKLYGMLLFVSRFIVSLLITVLFERLVAKITGYDSFVSSLKKAAQFTKNGVFFEFPSFNEFLILGFFALFLFLVSNYLKSQFNTQRLMLTFRPLGLSFKSLEVELLQFLNSIVTSPKPREATHARHDQNLDRLIESRNLAFQSLTSFLNINVDPGSIEKCYEILVKLVRDNSGSSKKVVRIVACTTLDPRLWSHEPLGRYLLATLGLDKISDTSTIKKRFVFSDQCPDDELRRVVDSHSIFNFDVELAQASKFEPIISRQKVNGIVIPDPAFLYIELVDTSASGSVASTEVVFFHMEFSSEPRSPFSKHFVQKQWDSANNDIKAYDEAIKMLCP
jgi:hypothetical protein